MADDHQLFIVFYLAAREIESRENACAEIRIGEQLHRRAEFAQFVAEVFGDARGGRRLTRHGFLLDEPANEVEHLCLPRLKISL